MTPSTASDLTFGSNGRSNKCHNSKPWPSDSTAPNLIFGVVGLAQTAKSLSPREHRRIRGLEAANKVALARGAKDT